MIFKTTGLTESPGERIGGEESRTKCQALGYSFQPLIPATEEDESGGGRKEARRVWSPGIQRSECLERDASTLRNAAKKSNKTKTHTKR